MRLAAALVNYIYIYIYNSLGIDPQWCHWGFFPRLTPEPCALGSTQPLKISTRKIPGSKAGRCVRLTTYHLLVPNVKKVRGLNLPDLPWACSGLLRDSFFFTYITKKNSD
jgi:hypothetical protein